MGMKVAMLPGQRRDSPARAFSRGFFKPQFDQSTDA
jgi:hypothetical protein